jgi:fatty acid desaturase
MNATSETTAEAHEPHWISRSAFQIISFFFFSTQGALMFAVSKGWYWLAVPLVLVVSHLMHGFLIGFHEASHGMLRKNRLINDLEGVMIGVFSLMSFTLFRAVHQTHHMHLASERDEEMWPLVQTRCPRWLRCVSAFFELNAGLIFSPLIFLRAFLSRNSPVRSKRVRRRIWAELALSAAFWTVVISAVAWWGLWKYFFWLYFAPAVIAANLQSWRKYIEHVGMEGATVNAATRSIVSDTLMGRIVAFTLLHEPFHGVHHRRAGLPHAELPLNRSELTPTAPDEPGPFPSYSRAFRHLFRSLTNPRAGAQWRSQAPLSQ